VSPTHGEQENSVWNGHYACTCYHPLFVFNQFGDLERCTLRPGNVHSADGWESVFNRDSPDDSRAEVNICAFPLNRMLQNRSLRYMTELVPGPPVAYRAPVPPALVKPRGTRAREGELFYGL
jgi:Transposase DDE domain group 1